MSKTTEGDFWSNRLPTPNLDQTARASTYLPLPTAHLYIINARLADAEPAGLVMGCTACGTLE